MPTRRKACFKTSKPISSVDPQARVEDRVTDDIGFEVFEQAFRLVGILPRAHGSALFTRGETQALCVATLGTGQDEQMIDALEGDHPEHLMLHYNFPPYSV